MINLGCAHSWGELDRVSVAAQIKDQVEERGLTLRLKPPHLAITTALQEAKSYII